MPEEDDVVAVENSGEEAPVAAPTMLSTDELVNEAMRLIPQLERANNELRLMATCFSFIGSDVEAPVVKKEMMFEMLQAGPGWTEDDAQRALQRIRGVVGANLVAMQVNFRRQTDEEGGSGMSGVTALTGADVQARYSQEIAQQLQWENAAITLKQEALEVAEARDIETEEETDERTDIAKTAGNLFRRALYMPKEEVSEVTPPENTWIKGSVLIQVAGEAEKLQMVKRILGMGANAEQMLENLSMDQAYIEDLVATVIQSCDKQIADAAINKTGATNDYQTFAAGFEANIWFTAILDAVETAYLMS